MRDAPGAIAPGAEVVHVRRLSRAFDGRGALREVNLDIRTGEVVALLGRVGSGKSTLLRILARLDTEFDGEVRLPERVGLTFQDGRLLPWRRVLDNVQLGRPGLQGRASALRLLDEVGLTSHAQAWPRELTGGEAQRAGLARALMGHPELLLMDEPFAALDALTRIRLRRLVRALLARHRPGVLLATHDVEEALLLADRVVVLTDGSVSRAQVVDLPPRGRRSHPGFALLRRELLTELGVGDDDLD